MKKTTFINRLKGLTKSIAILSLAIFQVSFFMKPFVQNQIERGLAQEVGSSEGDYPIGVVQDEVPLRRTDDSAVEDLTIEDENGDMVNNYDLIPEKLPEVSDIKQALKNFSEKEEQCLVRPEDLAKMNKYKSNYKKALEYYNSDRTVDNKDSVKLALSELADKLVDLELLKAYRTGSSDGAPEDLDISQYDLELDSKETAPSRAASLFLDKSDPSDLKKIGECHLERINALATDEEKKVYYETHVASLYADNLGTNLVDGSQKDLQTTANNFYTQSSSAEEQLNNQYGLPYSAQTHGQSALIANTKINEIKALQTQLAANPTDSTILPKIQALQTQLVSDLQAVNTKAKAAAATALATNPENLKIAQQSIDTATQYWAQESYKALAGQPTTAFSDFSPTTPTSVANPNTIVTGQQSTLFPNTALAGNTGIANLDPNNAMTWSPPGTVPSALAANTGNGQAVRRNGIALRPNGIDSSVQPIARPAVGN
jgi:hypothetical protein